MVNNTYTNKYNLTGLQLALFVPILTAHNTEFENYTILITIPSNFKPISDNFTNLFMRHYLDSYLDPFHYRAVILYNNGQCKPSEQEVCLNPSHSKALTLFDNSIYLRPTPIHMIDIIWKWIPHICATVVIIAELAYLFLSKIIYTAPILKQPILLGLSEETPLSLQEPKYSTNKETIVGNYVRQMAHMFGHHAKTDNLLAEKTDPIKSQFKEQLIALGSSVVAAKSQGDLQAGEEL